MQYLRRIYKYTGLSAIMVSMMLASCINDNSLCRVDGDEEDQITLEFTVVTRDLSGNGTRALKIPENTLKGSAAENYLDLRNTVFLLFDNRQTLIKVFKPDVTPDDDEYATYSVRAFISADEFATLTGGNTTGSINFSIAVVGNYSLLSPQNAGYHIGMTLDEIFNQSATTATFEMPTSNNWYNVWIPSIYGTDYTDAAGRVYDGMTPAHIPMAGIKTYNVPIASLQASTLQNPLNLSAATDGSGDINMLRALAKIEVVDRIDYGRDVEDTQPDRNSRTWIEKVELVGHTTRGSLFPNFDQWNLGNALETQYVTAPSIPASGGYVGATPSGGTLTVPGNTLVQFFADAAATDSREDNCRVFTCYLTEINPNILTANDPRPWIRITAHGPNQEGNDQNDNESMPYRVELAPYYGGNPGATMGILRNNIYRYEISGLSTWLDLHLVVDDWSKAETEWSYKANPALAEGGEINWNGATIVVNTTTANVVASYGEELTGRFTFAEPEGGTWTAELVADQGDFRAFAFVDAEGNELVDEEGNPLTVSGPIDGKPSTIRIKPMLPAGINPRAARLLFTVLTPDGRTLSANVLGNAYRTDKTYFTIYQDSSL